MDERYGKGRPAGDGNPYNGLPLLDHQKGARYQMSRRRYTKNPGYFKFLPRIFPYFVQKSREDILALVSDLVVENADVDADDFMSFAVTTHTRALDGHITLWLSASAAQTLLNLSLVQSVQESEGWASNKD